MLSSRCRAGHHVFCLLVQWDWKKAEELVSLRVEDWEKGFKTGEELEFEAAAG